MFDPLNLHRKADSRHQYICETRLRTQSQARLQNTGPSVKIIQTQADFEETSPDLVWRLISSSGRVWRSGPEFGESPNAGPSLQTMGLSLEKTCQSGAGSKNNYLRDQKEIIDTRIKNKLFTGSKTNYLAWRCQNAAIYIIFGQQRAHFTAPAEKKHFPLQAQYAKVTLAPPVRKSQLFRYKRSSINESSIG